MIGYKALSVRSGIIRAKNVAFSDIFEIGIPKQKVEIYDGIGFTENGYSFCTKIENILPWYNYFLDIYNYESIRLFLIDTLDFKVINSGDHYKAESLKIIREISKEEIIEYYEKSPDKLPDEFKEYYLNFLELERKPYRVIIDKEEIEKTIVNSCMRRDQKSICFQEEGTESLSICKKCFGYSLPGDVEDKLPDYWYLEARRKIYEGEDINSILEIDYLRNSKKCEKVVENIELLYNSRMLLKID